MTAHFNNQPVEAVDKEFHIEHFEKSAVVPPRLGRCSLADVKRRPQQVLSWLGLSTLVMPSIANAYEGVDPWLMGRVGPLQ